MKFVKQATITLIAFLFLSTQASAFEWGDIGKVVDVVKQTGLLGVVVEESEDQSPSPPMYTNLDDDTSTQVINDRQIDNGASFTSENHLYKWADKYDVDGIKLGMSIEEISKVLGANLTPDKYSISNTHPVLGRLNKNKKQRLWFKEFSAGVPNSKRFRWDVDDKFTEYLIENNINVMYTITHRISQPSVGSSRYSFHFDHNKNLDSFIAEKKYIGNYLVENVVSKIKDKYGHFSISAQDKNRSQPPIIFHPEGGDPLGLSIDYRGVLDGVDVNFSIEAKVSEMELSLKQLIEEMHVAYVNIAKKIRDEKYSSDADYSKITF